MSRRELESTIHEAMRKGLFQQVRLLVLLGRSVNAKNERGQTPLMLCSLVEDEEWGVKLARLLLETHSAVLDQTDFRGLTALHYACLFCRQRLVETFLGYSGFDIQRLDILYNRPVHYAAYSGNPYIVEALLRHDRDLGVSPAGWMTENAAGHTPIAVAKIYRRPGCYVILKDLVGEIKYPTEMDVHLTRLMTDRSYEDEARRDEILKAGCGVLGGKKNNSDDPDVGFMDEYHPNYRQRRRMSLTSRAIGLGGPAADVSHLENEASRKNLTRYAVHFSLDLNDWTYLDRPRYVERLFKARPVAPVVDGSVPQLPSKKGTETKLALVPSDGKKTKAKAGEYAGSKFERQQGEVKDGGKAEKEEEEEEEEEKDPRTVCRKYVLEEYIPECKDEDEDVEVEDGEDDEAADEKDDKGADEGEEKRRESGKKAVKEKAIKDDKREDKEEMKDKNEEEKSADDGSLIVSRRTYSPPSVAPPRLRSLEIKCKDAAEALANFRRPGLTVTNAPAGKKPATSTRARRHLVCTIAELVLPRVEPAPPYSKRCRRLMREIFDGGLFTVASLKETRLVWNWRLEWKMLGLYCREYGKMNVRTVDSFPPGNHHPRALFQKIFYEPKAKRRPRPCSIPFPYFRVDYHETCEPPKRDTGDTMERILVELAARYRRPLKEGEEEKEKLLPEPKESKEVVEVPTKQ